MEDPGSGLFESFRSYVTNRDFASWNRAALVDGVPGDVVSTNLSLGVVDFQLVPSWEVEYEGCFRFRFMVDLCIHRHLNYVCVCTVYRCINYLHMYWIVLIYLWLRDSHEAIIIYAPGHIYLGQKWNVQQQEVSLVAMGGRCQNCFPSRSSGGPTSPTFSGATERWHHKIGQHLPIRVVSGAGKHLWISQRP